MALAIPVPLRTLRAQTLDDPAGIGIVQPRQLVATDVERDDGTIRLQGRHEGQAHVDHPERLDLEPRPPPDVDRIGPGVIETAREVLVAYGAETRPNCKSLPGNQQRRRPTASLSTTLRRSAAEHDRG